MSEPERSSSRNVKPPAVPTPGMAGGAKPNTTAWGSLPNSRFRVAFNDSNCWALVVRSSQGLKFTKKVAL